MRDAMRMYGVSIHAPLTDEQFERARRLAGVWPASSSSIVIGDCSSDGCPGLARGRFTSVTPELEAWMSAVPSVQTSKACGG